MRITLIMEFGWVMLVSVVSASHRRLQSSSSQLVYCPYHDEPCDCLCDCDELRCGCDHVKNTSSCCSGRSYSACTDDDEREARGFAMGSILRQVWFVFIAMGVVSAVIWRRRMRQRRMLMAQHHAGTNYITSPRTDGGYPGAAGYPAAYGQPVEGQPIQGVPVHAHAVTVADVTPGRPTAGACSTVFPQNVSAYPSGAATGGTAPMVTVQGRAVCAQPVIASATAAAGPAPVATATAVPPTATVVGQ
mmetsp:Transcript_117/g.261  ORF Transcript_117/g.261 Transcript_117/m.261 type:complete len:247 (-) Transcript_117:101-841(-)|eukprot:CAMPEP_0119071690 /NCGR_PEP_ID=MMETSP1178-20130426/53164_1 /TAXON_ID=33656 /ORGANISM="unid sp, Strain CCMP2000" /LENGTH=246 /DNA_ID=CAMNT_0007053631 /DNA_START=20 /DNA_END=760 /DNA_ORIENTATION=-